ncbi:Ger(x)C family spore germination protein [Bacillus spongiae]|uniref:Ger(X)C family spore germination protein n=1 Tax=Bacillus spongiae TaxID=2683610 RepID=A0ABU8HHN3_9BACI
MKKKWIKWLSSLLILLILNGCTQKNYLEKIGLLTAVGYDVAEDDFMEGTLVVNQFDPQKTDPSKVISAKAYTSKGMRQKLNLEVSNSLVSGQLRVALYGSELAEGGISHLVDSLARDASIGNMLYIAITDPPASEILKFQSEEIQGNMGTYLYNLIQQNIDLELVSDPTLHTFTTKLLDVGIDPILPIFEIIDGNIGIRSVAVFHDDHLVGKLPLHDLFYFNLLDTDYRKGSLEIQIEKEKLEKYFTYEQREDTTIEEDEMNFYITVNNISTSKDVKLTDTNPSQPKFDLEIDLNVRIIEMSKAMDLGKPEVIKALSKTIEKKIKKEVERTLKDLQELKTDPVGFGRYYRAFAKSDLTKEEWRNMYGNSKFNVKVTAEIIRTGVID